jgi:hypothetical protein
MYANTLPKNVKTWMKKRTLTDLESEYFYSGSDKSIKIQEIINLLYDLGQYNKVEVETPAEVTA